MTEQEFHRARRMWAVDDEVLVAPENDPRTHYEWLCSFFGPEVVRDRFENMTRGYVLDGVLCSYKGHDFSRWVDYAAVLRALECMERVCGPIHTIHMGVRQGGGKQPWDPVVKCDAAEFRNHMAKKGK